MGYTKNLTLMTDMYQLTMMQGYFKLGRHERVVFDAFYRSNPCGGGYAICAGLADIIDYVKNIQFTDEDIEYLRQTGAFEEDFLAYLKGFRFTGDIYAVPEGTVIHPMEPLVKVVAPIDQAQLVETTILNLLNHQSLIATKAARVCYAAKGDAVMEFGLRRAQGPDAGNLGARAAIIGGCVGTSNVLASKLYDMIPLGTHSHSWIMSFPDEFTAFMAYANVYKENVILLVDTYNTLESGVPNAIKVFKKLREEKRLPKKYGIRLDSGDLAYLSKKAKEMFDAEGFEGVTICASSDLDEYLITSLKNQGATINQWGVGTNMITSKDCPAFGGVYKLAAVEENGSFVPKIKKSENSVKITNPGNKTVYRIYDTEGMAIADLICLADEVIDNTKALTLFDPVETWKKTTLQAGEYCVEEILKPIFKDGKCVYEVPTTNEIKALRERDMSRLWDETKRFEYPHTYYVDLSQKLWDIKMELLNQ